MSRLTRVMVLGAMLAAMTLAGLTAVAQAQPTAGDEKRASQDQSTSDSVKRAAEAQERYYSTWSYGDTPAPAPDEPSGQPDRGCPARRGSSAAVRGDQAASSLVGATAMVASRAARRAGRYR
jgi:hypothetical protein